MRVDWYGQAAFHLTERPPTGRTGFDTDSLPGDERALVVVPAVP